MTIDNPALPFRIMRAIWQTAASATNEEAARAKITLRVHVFADAETKHPRNTTLEREATSL